MLCITSTPNERDPSCLRGPLRKTWRKRTNDRQWSLELLVIPLSHSLYRHPFYSSVYKWRVHTPSSPRWSAPLYSSRPSPFHLFPFKPRHKVWYHLEKALGYQVLLHPLVRFSLSLSTCCISVRGKKRGGGTSTFHSQRRHADSDLGVLIDAAGYSCDPNECKLPDCQVSSLPCPP